MAVLSLLDRGPIARIDAELVKGKMCLEKAASFFVRSAPLEPGERTSTMISGSGVAMASRPIALLHYTVTSCLRFVRSPIRILVPYEKTRRASLGDGGL